MKDQDQQNGFSLLEVLVAILILAFGALALVQIMALGLKLNVQATDDTQATTLGQWKIETLTGLGYQNLVPGGNLSTSVTNYYETFQQPNSSVIYTENWKISPCGHDDPTIDCAVSEEYYQTPWYEISVRVYANRMDRVANTQARQITLKAIILQPF